MAETSRFLKEIPEALVKRNVLAAREMVEARVNPPKPPPKKKTPKRTKRPASAGG